MSAPNNPAAFPCVHDRHLQEGMSQRDWFAGQALAGIAQEYLHRNGFGHETMPQNLAIHAYRIADAMMARGEQ